MFSLAMKPRIVILASWRSDDRSERKSHREVSCIRKAIKRREKRLCRRVFTALGHSYRVSTCVRRLFPPRAACVFHGSSLIPEKYSAARPEQTVEIYTSLLMAHWPQWPVLYPRQPRARDFSIGKGCLARRIEGNFADEFGKRATTLKAPRTAGSLRGRSLNDS